MYTHKFHFAFKLFVISCQCRMKNKQNYTRNCIQHIFLRHTHTTFELETNSLFWMFLFFLFLLICLFINFDKFIFRVYKYRCTEHTLLINKKSLFIRISQKIFYLQMTTSFQMFYIWLSAKPFNVISVDDTPFQRFRWDAIQMQFFGEKWRKSKIGSYNNKIYP